MGPKPAAVLCFSFLPFAYLSSRLPAIFSCRAGCLSFGNLSPYFTCSTRSPASHVLEASGLPYPYGRLRRSKRLDSSRIVRNLPRFQELGNERQIHIVPGSCRRFFDTIVANIHLVFENERPFYESIYQEFNHPMNEKDWPL